MKKLLKLSLIVSMMLLLLTNCCYATSSNVNETGDSYVIPPEWARTLDPNASSSDMLLDEAFETLYTGTQDEGIMPISGDFELPSNVIESDIYEINENISIEGDVNGNIYVIGKNINISSEYLNGNVFAIGQDITIKGLVSGSLYLMGQNVNIETGSVDTVYAMGSVVNLAENANIMDDFKVSAGSLNISGNVNRELDAYVENINVSEKSEYIGKGYVSYSTNYSDPNKVLETVEVTVHEKAEEKAEAVKSLVIANKIRSEVISTISSVLIIGIIYLIIKNRQMVKVENYSQEILVNTCKGLGWLIAIPVISIILLCTIIGIPVSILLITMYIVGICISVPVASLRISELICDYKPSNKSYVFLYAVAVYVVIKLISLVPILGGLINFIIALYGFESLIKYIFPGKNNNVKKEEVVIKEDNI